MHLRQILQALETQNGLLNGTSSIQQKEVYKSTKESRDKNASKISSFIPIFPFLSSKRIFFYFSTFLFAYFFFHIQTLSYIIRSQRKLVAVTFALAYTYTCPPATFALGRHIAHPTLALPTPALPASAHRNLNLYWLFVIAAYDVLPGSYR